MVIASLAPVGWTASMSPEAVRPEIATAFGESPTAKGIVRPLIETSRVKPLRSILGSQILIPIVPVPDIALAAIVDYPGALVGAAYLDSATGSLIPVPPIPAKNGEASTLPGAAQGPAIGERNGRAGYPVAISVDRKPIAQALTQTPVGRAVRIPVDAVIRLHGRQPRCHGKQDD